LVGESRFRWEKWEKRKKEGFLDAGFRELKITLGRYERERGGICHKMGFV
jgi:hypothetical protein